MICTLNLQPNLQKRSEVNCELIQTQTEGRKKDMKRGTGMAKSHLLMLIVTFNEKRGALWAEGQNGQAAAARRLWNSGWTSWLPGLAQAQLQSL